jgi:hypothetical protein
LCFDPADPETLFVLLRLSGCRSGGMASVAFALWLIGAVIGVLRAARLTPQPTVPVSFDADDKNGNVV